MSRIRCLLLGALFASGLAAQVEPQGHETHEHDHDEHGENHPAHADPVSRARSLKNLTLRDVTGKGADSAILRFAVLDKKGGFVPCRLTFIPAQGDPRPDLFPVKDAAPLELAVRRNLIYSRTGVGLITVPPGSYRVLASHGPEWSIASREFEFLPGREVLWAAQIEREIDSTGFVSGDCHLHTLTHSGHGDCNLEERVITLLGEGLEFAVATDHNFTTDYEPIVRELGAEGEILVIRGNEVTVPIGHFNCFPLGDWATHPYRFARDAGELFTWLRAQGNPLQLPVLIQANHPRWSGMDYFGLTGLDPVTACSDLSSWSPDFDCIEVLNENAAWGYFDADRPEGRVVGDSRHQVLGDWFRLLNRGLRLTATGNSDSHHVEALIAGVPRNFVASPTDSPAELKASDVVLALKRGASFASTGPFLRFRVNGKGSGEVVEPDDDGLRAEIEIQAASWIAVDRVKLVMNGEVLQEIPVPAERQPLRLKTTIPLDPWHDSWVALLVEGDTGMEPVLPLQKRPCLPLAIANPVYIDADGDGIYRSPLDTVRRLLENDDELASRRTLLPAERNLLLLEAVQKAHPAADRLIREALDGDRSERLTALAAITRMARPDMAAFVQALPMRNDDGAFFAARLTAARLACGSIDALGELRSFETTHGSEALRRYGDEFVDRLGGSAVRDWRVLRFLPGETVAALDETLPPESDPQLSLPFAPAGAARLDWEPLKSDEQGRLDLQRPGADGQLEGGVHALAYAGCLIDAQDDTPVGILFGSDDGCRLFLNGRLIHEDRGQHADRLNQFMGTFTLKKGRNVLLAKVWNAGGAFGLKARLLGKGFTVVATIEESGEK